MSKARLKSIAQDYDAIDAEGRLGMFIKARSRGDEAEAVRILRASETTAECPDFMPGLLTVAAVEHWFQTRLLTLAARFHNAEDVAAELLAVAAAHRSWQEEFPSSWTVPTVLAIAEGQAAAMADIDPAAVAAVLKEAVALRKAEEKVLPLQNTNDEKLIKRIGAAIWVYLRSTPSEELDAAAADFADATAPAKPEQPTGEASADPSILPLFAAKPVLFNIASDDVLPLFENGD